MSTGEDEPLPVLNARLRPRKSTTNTPSSQNFNTRKSEGKLAQDKPKRTSGQSKASPDQQNDLAAKSDTSPTLHFLCPYCDRTFANKQTASKHARRIHLSTPKQDNFIKCLHCNHSDAESHAIIKHMVDRHPNQYFACLVCSTRFHSTAELAEHKLNVCENQKPPYRNKLRKKSAVTKRNLIRHGADEKSDSSNENGQYTDERVFNGIVISCELKSSEIHDAVDIEDKITTNLILPPSRTLANATMEKNAVIVLDDLQWNKRIPPNFSFHNTDADQILSRLGVVHRSPRVGESKEDLIRMMDEPNEKFEKCFDTSFYSKVAKNVQDNLTKCLDGSFGYNSNKDNTIKTRKAKMSVMINTAEGFPILLAYEQFSRNLFGGFLPRTMAPKHKWKWDTTENDKFAVMLLDQTKRDSHVNNCIITLVSSLDIWTQLRMRAKFEEIYKTTPTAKKTVKQNIISMELKEILESRDIPTTSTQVVQYRENPVVAREGFELPAYLGLSPRTSKCDLQPAVLSGEWVRPRCYVCCACGEQNGDARSLSAHITSQHPNAQVQHYEIVGETLLSADILKHLYVPPNQMSNRTRPPRGFRDCTKCKKSITLEDLHQHMLDCAGDTPTVRRKCRYRPFGVRRRRTRLPDNTIRKKMRKDIRSRHRQKVNLRPRIRTEVGDAETIRKMIADLPAKRNRITPSSVLRPRRNIIKVIKTVKLRSSKNIKANKTPKNLIKVTKTDATNKQNDSDDSVDEDDQPLKLSAKRISTRSSDAKDAGPSRINIKRRKIKKQLIISDSSMKAYRRTPTYVPPKQTNPPNQTNLPNPTNLYNNEAYSIMPPIIYPSQPPLGWPDASYCYNLQLPYSNEAMEQSIYPIQTLEQPIVMQPSSWRLNPDRAGSLEKQCDVVKTIRPTPRYPLLHCQRDIHQEQPNKRNNRQFNKKEQPSMPGKHNLRAKPPNKLDKDSLLNYEQARKHESSANPRENQLADEQENHLALAKEHALKVQISNEYAHRFHVMQNQREQMQLAQAQAYDIQPEYPQPIEPQNCFNNILQPGEQGNNIPLAQYYSQYVQSQNEAELSQLSQDETHNIQLAKDYQHYMQLQNQSEPFQQPHEQAQYIPMTKKLSEPNVQLPEEQAHHVQMTKELPESNVHLPNEQVHSVQMTEELSEPNVPLPKEQAHSVEMAEEPSEPKFKLPKEQAHNVQMAEEMSKPNVKLPKEQAHSIQMSEEMSEPNVQLPKEQARNVPMTEELPELNVQLPQEQAHNIQSVQEQAKYNQLPSEYVTHIPVTKELKKHDQLTKEGGKHILTKEQINEKIDVRGAGPSNIRQHSNRDEYDMQNGKNRPSERGDDGNKNYNTTPASNMPLKHSIASLTTETEPQDLSVSKNPDLLHQNMNITIKHTPEDNRQEFENETLPEELHKPPLQCHPVDHKTTDAHLPILDISQIHGSNLSNNLFKSNGTVEEQMEIKNETDKSKLNKTRKGLNDCIAMLLTKKGLRGGLDRASNTCGDDVNMEYAAIETRSGLVEVNPPPADRLLSEQNNYLIPGSVSDNSVNLTPAQVFSRSVLSVNYRCESYPGTDIEPNSINHFTLQSTSADRGLVSQSSTQNEDKREFTRIRSSSETEYKSACQKAHPSWTEPKQSNDVNPCQILQNMRHNSYDGVPIHGEAQRFLKIRQSETVNSLNQIQIESKTKNIGRSDGDLQERYSKHFTQETLNQQSKVIRSKEGEAYVPNTSENVKIPAPQGTLSPTCRRSRRKPTKNDPFLIRPQLTMNYRRSPPLQTNADKQTSNFRPGVEDPNMHLVSARYLPASSSDTLSINSLQASQVPRELYQRNLDSSETAANVVANHKDGPLNKVVKQPTETRAQKIKRLRRCSIELADAQSKIASYEAMMMQSYLESWNKDLRNAPSSSGEPSQWHKMISQAYLKQFHGSNVHCETSNEVPPHPTSSLMFASSNQDMIGTLHVNPIGEPSGLLNKTNANEDNFNKVLENEHYGQSSRFQNALTESLKNYAGSNVDCRAKEDERNKQKITDQEYKTNTQKSNVLDNNSQKHGFRQGSGEHFTRSSPYQHNFVDTSHEKNQNSDDNSLQHAHRKAVSYAIPAVPCSDNTYRAMPMVPSIPHALNAEEAPLDLSCDSNSREEKAHELYKKSLDVFKKPSDISITNVIDADPAVTTTCRNITEQLHNIPTNLHFTGYKTTIDEPNEDLHLSADDGSLGATRINNILHETNVSNNQLDHGLSPSNTANFHCSGPNISDNSLYNSSHENLSNIEMDTTIKVQDNGNSNASGQLLSHPPENNLHTLRQSQGCNSTISRQESMQDKTFCENKKITRVSSTQVSPIVPERRSSSVETDLVNPIVGNVDPHPNLEMDDPMTSVNITTENEMSGPKDQTTETESAGIDHSQMSSQKNPEGVVVKKQDPETARKIAMLPKELVEIIGTMPVDHRIQLLNILPQYVSNHASSVEKETEDNISSATVAQQTSDTLQIENKQDTITCSNLNTNISPSRILPKKRHPPSQATVESNINEAEQSLPVLHPSEMIVPTLSQLHPAAYDDNLVNKAQSIQNAHQNNDSASYIKDPFTETMSQDSEDTEINVVDLSEPENSNITTVVSTSVGNVIYSSPPQQSLMPRPSTSKNSNEQTASLRAVRIKTTSARKSLSDENNKSKIKSEIQTDMLIRTSSDQNSTEDNNDPNENKAIEPTVTRKTGDGKEHETSVIPKSTSTVSQNEHVSYNSPGDANPPNQEGRNQEHNHFLGLVKPTTFSGGGKHNDAVTVQQSHRGEFSNNNAEKNVSITITSPPCIMDSSGNDFTTASNHVNKLDTMEKNSQCSTEKTVNRSSKINEVKETLSTDFVQHKKLQLNSNTDASQSETTSHFLSSEHIIDSKSSCKSRSEELSPKDEKHNEDDSEDEVSLAVLKQKQSRQATFPQQGNFSAKFEYEEKKHQPKQERKNRKKKNPKNSKIIQNHKLFEDCIDNVKESSEIELSFDDTQVNDDQNELIAKSIPVNTTGIDKDKTKNHYEFDVNKENNETENIIKIKEDDLIILPESNQSENELDSSSINTNIEGCREPPNFTMGLNVIPESSASQETKDSTTVEATHEPEVKENLAIVKGSQSKHKSRKIKTSKSHIGHNDQNLRNKHLAESENDSDACDINEFNLLTSETIETPDINMSKPKPEDKRAEVSTKMSTYETPQDNVVRDFQLCSDIPDMITTPLRRSRRGKSMYVDSNCLEDSGHVVDVEYIDQRTPLTMKQLILSRVEKEKKRFIDHNIFETSCNAEVVHLINSEVTDVSRTKKRKMIVKKSKSTRKSKKSKSRNNHENDEDTSDVSTMHSASEKNSTMLWEMSKSEGIESCTEDVKNEVNSENKTGLSKDYKEKISNAFGHCTTDLQELDVAEKRKLKFTEMTDLVSCKSKKSKYNCKEKASSDFESDDEKVLSKTKNQASNEKHQILNKDESTNSTNKSPTNILNTEDSDDTPLKICSGVNTESNIETNKAGIIVETRTTCYNRPVSSRRHRSSSASLKDNADYDPYNIDFEDMLEPMRPIIKKKFKNIQATNVKHHDKLNIKSDNFKLTDTNSTPLNSFKPTTNETIIHNESDSDSSKSDVPLQKYVDDKTLESELKNKNKQTRNDSIEDKEKMDEEGFKPNSDCIQPNYDHPSQSGQNEGKTSNLKLKVKISQPGKGKKSTKRVKKCHSLLEDETSNKDDNLNMSNNISTEQTRQKQQRRNKKSHDTLATPKIGNADSVSKEEDLQLRSDKFMENFGFYSERIPRKSNLLASKKIAETYSMISNESDDNYFRHKEKPIKKPTQNDKKKSEIGSDVNVSQDPKNDETNCNVQLIESKIDVVKNITSNEPDVLPTDDGDLDSLTAQNILESEEIRNLENALFSTFKEAADANAATNCYLNFQPSNSAQSFRQDVDPNVSTVQAEEDQQKICEQPETTNKQTKSKPNKQPGVKDKMYPDIEEIDMLEDKFDKIKRKRRSQAVAAKQVQSVIESCTSVKSRKPTERKRTPKNTKRNYQSTQVPTKGALKGFDGIKISIPTQDLNMPLNVSPPRQQKKRRKTASKRRKETSESESSGTEFYDKDKSVSERDIYEFKDNEDAELFELRPSTVMDRFRSMHVKNKCKNKEKDKGTGEVEKEKHRERPKEKEKRVEIKEIELINDEAQKAKKRKDTEFDKRQKKYLSLAEGRNVEKKSPKELSYSETKLDIKAKREKNNKHGNFTSSLGRVVMSNINEDSTRPEKCLSETTRNRDISFMEEDDYAKASTSGFIPNRDDESDYESELSSPEGEFIFYMSNDINCICPSDNDSDDSDVERGCGRPNCIYKNRNADKNAAIGNIFKNNAVRCEKTDVKEPEVPRPDLDLLFDSLFETNNSDLSRNHNNDATQESLAPWPTTAIAHAENIRKSKSSASHHDLHISPINKQELHPNTSNKVDTSLVSEGSSISGRQNLMSLVSIKNKPDETYTAKCNETSALALDIQISDCESIQMLMTDNPKEKLDLGQGAKDCTEGYFAKTIKDVSLSKNKANEKLMAKSEVLTMKAAIPDQPTKYKSEDKSETNKPASLKRRHKRHITPPEKKTDAEHRNDVPDTDSCNESAVSKYLKRLTSEEAAHIEIYTMVSAQGTQTANSNRHSTSNSEDMSGFKTEDELDMRDILKSRIRLQKFNVLEISQTPKSSIGIQTDKSNSKKSYDSQNETDDDDGINEDDDCTVKGPICNTKNDHGSTRDLNEESRITPSKDVNSFVTPTLKPTVDKHSPRKSDEGISMSHDYSADAFDQSSFDDTGVARQRARRKCTVGKQNVLAEHWSSESEFDGAPPRPTSADSVVASVSRKKKSKKKEGHHSGGKRGRHSFKNGSKSLRERGASGAVSDDSDACPGPSRAPHGPKIRARPAHHYWSSDGEDAPDPQPQHGWIVGDSHKKLVTMLAHAKGRKRTSGEKRHLLD